MGTPTILVVDDEQDLANLYALWIGEEYDTLTAYGGREAMEKMSDDVDIVLLDRRMPEVTGDQVLQAIRERGYDCMIVMITAVDPGLDVVEMDFDKYLTKPISRPQLRRVIENMRVQLRREGKLKEHTSVSNKMEVLEEQIEPGELEDSEGYQDLQQQLKDLGDALTDGLSETAANRGREATDEQTPEVDDLGESLDLGDASAEN